MRKKALAVLFAVCMIFSAAGCGRGGHGGVNSFGNTTNGIYVHKDASVQDVVYYDFDTEKYDVDEFRTFLQAELDEYNNSHEFIKPEPETNADGEVVSESSMTAPIEIVECSAKNNELCVQLLYANTGDYLTYMAESVEERGGNTLQSGYLLYADASVQNAAFVDEDGDAIDMEKLLGSKKADRYRYVICNFESVIYSDGNVCGYTVNGTYSKENNCVTVPAGQEVIVLFK